MSSEIKTVETYIKQCPVNVQYKLAKLRKLIKTSIPDVQEKISWGAPTYYEHGYLLQFALCKNHIGFYTSPEVMRLFKEPLKDYHTNDKNTLHLPLDQELPEALLKDMILAQRNFNRQKEK